MLFTAQELAEETGRPLRTVQWHCKRVGLRKIAGSYVMDNRQARKVLASLQQQAGDEPGEQPSKPTE